ncbi:MAG: NADPH-dependent 7-cyano-7-deazaguanine reductase QueF [Candidatus Omnitrophica bacterium]|nr:NADPH-dependent 7-cyano-7-deazaguanine reductase QueF [Candidatus Omnitrophota bacterium]
MSTRKSSYEDLQSHIRRLQLPAIEVWTNQYADRKYMVALNTDECTCICPKTGLPDFVTLNITYGPDKTCVELKSFKMYLVSYRNIGIFHEHLVNRILDDIVKACKPHWVRVEGIVAPRGGIETTVVAEYQRKKGTR